MKKLLMLWGILFLGSYTTLLPQCFGTPCSDLVTPNPVSDCNPGVQTALTNNATIAAGQTHYYSGGAASFSGVNVNGGTLVICGGPVTFNGFDFSTGNVIITATGSVNYSNYYNAGANNLTFYNYGLAEFNIDINVQGSSTHMIYNAPTGIINTSGRMDIFNGGVVVNDGAINVAGELRIQGSGQACLGSGSYLNTTDLWVHNTNPVSVPLGTACVGYTDKMQGNGSLTNTSCLILCQDPLANDPVNPASTGSATFIEDCDDCVIALPIQLISFELSEVAKNVHIGWRVADETHIERYLLERADEKGVFESLTSIDARGTQWKEEQYFFQDNFPLLGTSYYRLIQENVDGKREELSLRSIEIVHEDGLAILPNPAYLGQDVDFLYTTGIPKTNMTLEIYSVIGDLIKLRAIPTNQRISVSNIPKGYYVVLIKDNEKFVTLSKLVILEN